MQALPVNSLLSGVVSHAFLATQNNAGFYRVLPGSHTVIGFQFSGRIHHAAENRALSQFGVTGILESWRAFRSEAGTSSLLIYFKPGGLYRIFGPVAGALGGASLALREILPAETERPFAEILGSALPAAEIWPLVEARLLRLMQRDISPETRGALYWMESKRGKMPVRHIAAELSVSPRTLERKFIAEVGASPKHLSRIIRWKSAMRNLGSYPDLGRAALAYGYFDQAHFIRETREFAGETPSVLAAGF